MRYITHISNLVLYKDDGDIGRDSTSHKGYTFGQQGELMLGTSTATGTGNEISTTDLQVLYAEDLDGNTATTLEMCGLGTLTGTTKTGGTVSPLSTGYRLFFEAPTLDAGDTVESTEGVYYKVLTGSITYNGTSYDAGKIFSTDGDATATSGDGTFRLTLPPDLVKSCYNKEAIDGIFAYKTLLRGNESDDYWNYSESGAEPKNSTTSTDSDYYGWD